MHEVKLLETFGIQANAIFNELEELFPPTTPQPGMSMEQIMYRAGQRSVIEWINQRIKE